MAFELRPVRRPRCPKCKSRELLRLDALLRMIAAGAALAYAGYLAWSVHRGAPAVIVIAVLLLLGTVIHQLYNIGNDYRIWCCKKCYFRFYYKRDL